MNTSTQTIVALCPACDTRIRFSKTPHLGQIVTCPECEETLEVVRRMPLTLDWAYDNEEEDDEEYSQSHRNGRHDPDDDWDDWDDEDWSDDDDD